MESSESLALGIAMERGSLLSIRPDQPIGIYQGMGEKDYGAILRPSRNFSHPQSSSFFPQSSAGLVAAPWPPVPLSALDSGEIVLRRNILS